ncbi:response regulator receiver sensor signal transduction histidine kinase [Fulvimarina pelagi HTCC2506]|uniref:histidine kinase n=1 Tax=Fulvimarina pelagi HTCC2506 TaxID=314231 RepID=Q0G6J7_9HYPH|nr:DUF3369 domain-containing protein [Fulvimarina pelagi]EAU42717.1 response regulator receiver sensor signal transduction histidine kinase [Fulvimarina pelagi HTCC2506]
MTGEFLEIVEDLSPANDVNGLRPWKIAVIDDDDAVHEGTRFALRHFRFADRPMEIVGAWSAEEGRALLRKHPDIAVVLLDVVMESDAAGLDLASQIRGELGNELVRIILRTGHPGEAPEHRVVLDYDINDYKAKTELTAERLFIALTTALRSYEQLKRLDEMRIGLELIVEGASRLFDDCSLTTLAKGVLIQLNTLLAIDCAGILVMREAEDGHPTVLASTGSFIEGANKLNFDRLFAAGVKTGLPMTVEGLTQLFVRTGRGVEILVLLDHADALEPTQIELLSVFSSKLAIAFENVRLNEELREANAALENRVEQRTADLAAVNQRLDAQAALLRRVNAFKNEMLGMVAHDLKNPLAVVLGRTEMLSTISRDLPEPNATLVSTQLNYIRTAANRMTRIVDVSIAEALADAFDIALDRRRVDLAAIVRSAAGLYSGLCEAKEQSLHVECPKRLLVTCDPDRMAEAIENLLSNAIKYAPIGGAIAIALNAGERAVTIRVDDSGPGLTQEDVMRVFGRFQRLSAQPTGGESSTGLGLSIVRRIAELHGGNVEVIEKGGLGGASFAIVLPLGPQEAAL